MDRFTDNFHGSFASRFGSQTFFLHFATVRSRAWLVKLIPGAARASAAKVWKVPGVVFEVSK